MSVLINLLPDLRLKRQRDKQRRQLATTTAAIVMAACGGFLVLMFVVTSGQTVLINNANDDIDTKKDTLANTENIIPALTSQAKLASISMLYAEKNLITKLMTVFNEVAPTTMQLTALKFNASTNQLELMGNVKTYAEAAKLDRALEAAHISIGTGSPTDEPYFTDVVLVTTTNDTGKAVQFTLTATVAPGATHEK